MEDVQGFIHYLMHSEICVSEEDVQILNHLFPSSKATVVLFSGAESMANLIGFDVRHAIVSLYSQSEVVIEEVPKRYWQSLWTCPQFSDVSRSQSTSTGLLSKSHEGGGGVELGGPTLSNTSRGGGEQNLKEDGSREGEKKAGEGGEEGGKKYGEEGSCSSKSRTITIKLIMRNSDAAFAPLVENLPIFSKINAGLVIRLQSWHGDTKMEVDMDVGFDSLEDSGWFQDTLSVSFECDDNERSFLSESKILSEVVSSVNEVTISNEISLGKSDGDKKTGYVEGGVLSLVSAGGNLDVETGVQKKETATRRSVSSFRTRCLQDCMYLTFFSCNVASRMGYTFCQIKDENFDFRTEWNDDMVMEGRKRGMLSVISLKLRGEWILVTDEGELDVVSHRFRASRELRRYRFSQMQDHRTICQALERKFYINHNFHQIQDLERFCRDEHVWILRRNRKSPVPQIIRSD